ncbi:MAG: thiol reductant ABC exporter subunit CydD [Chloroflexi bacterium]|nr:thiol reductant ABC exporter subunit CydD [Chloroflexota bacterium]
MTAIPRRPPSAAARLLTLDPGARGRLRAAIACGFAASALVVASAFLLATTVARVFLGGADLAAVAPLLAALALLAATRAACVWAAEVLGQRASSSLRGTLRDALTDRLQRLGPAFASGERTGELVSVLTAGLDAIDAWVASFQPARALAILVPALVLAVVAVVDPLSALVLVVTGPVLVLLLALIGGRAKALTERRFLELRWMSAFFADMLRGIATLKMFGRSAEQVENVGAIGRTYGDTTMEVLRTAFQTALVLEWGGAVATALVAVEVSLRLMAGEMAFERALAVLVVTPEFFLPLRQLAIRFHAGAAGDAAATRMLAILEAPTAAGPAAVGPAAAGPTGAPAAGPIGAAAPGSSPAPTSPPAVRLSGVHVAYEGGLRPALRGLDLDVPAGRTVALVGETGAGKSTVASLLLRFLDADLGDVTVDGTPLASIDVDAWRHAVAWVPQSPHLFAGTVADNIRLARPDAADADVEAAAREAGADGFIRALPLGYDTPLGEDGARLSGGQQQRIAIARAFLRDAPLVILDEATSHLDPASEAAIARAVQRLVRRRTVLVISHRLRLAAGADIVVVLAGGRAVEAGPPGVLLAHDGPYRRLVAIEAEAAS